MEVNKIIKGFKSKKSSLNSVHSFASKHTADIISPTLPSMINESVKEEIFPQCLKMARVIPIYKSGKKLLVENYRPISTLPFMSQIIEKLIHSRLYSYLMQYNILYENQLGF